MIEKKLINFKKESDYNQLKEAGNIKETSVVFIDDAKKIVTHNTEFDCSSYDDSVINGRVTNVENKLKTIPSFWVGDRDAYEALGTYDSNTFYFITGESNNIDLSEYAKTADVNAQLILKADKTDIPTDNSQLANGAGYITSSALSNLATKSEIPSLNGYATEVVVDNKLNALEEKINSKTWFGTEEQYNAIGDKDSSVTYYTTEE